MNFKFVIINNITNEEEIYTFSSEKILFKYNERRGSKDFSLVSNITDYGTSAIRELKEIAEDFFKKIEDSTEGSNYNINFSLALDNQENYQEIISGMPVAYCSFECYLNASNITPTNEPLISQLVFFSNPN